MIAICIYAALSALLIGIYRWLALRYRWLDTPNQRSSHAVITPRGAGVIFALLIIGAACVLLHSQHVILYSLLAGSGIAAAGWCDDIRGISTRVRFVLYALFAAAAVAFAFASESATANCNCTLTALSFYGALATIGLLWLINLYNFMDGINGLAAFEALFVLSAVAFFAQDTHYLRVFASLHLFGGAAIVGFLLWNFPAGKVFMGDAGSAFLGFFLGALLLWSTQLHGASPWIWLILLGIFIVDSAYTLLLRIATGQTWYAAHRLHAYQRLTDRLNSNHALTVATLMAVNLFWLLPMAWLVHNRQINALCGLGLAYSPLIAACYWLRAGISAQGRV